MPNDVKTNARVRKIVTGNWLDIAQVRCRVTRGVIHLQGHLSRHGEDPQSPESNEPFLRKLDEQLRLLPGFRGVHYAFDNWRREPTGLWRFIGRKIKGIRKLG